MPHHTPIYTALQQYVQHNKLRLHMPGHIGRGMTARELQPVAGIDVTEVPGLDDFHLPREIIGQSRTLLAHAYGAGESYFLVNGATSGLEALFLALTSEGEKVLVPRNARRSFYGGMVLSGAMPVYIPVQTMPEPGIALAVTAEDIRNLLGQSDKLVFLASPSYYGTTCDVEQIAQLVHESGRLLLVDEAHGAHFNFSPQLPPSALQCGADAAVNGLHKTLPVLNQGACLHLAESLKGSRSVNQAVSLITTTSPSYPIMASIELARALLEEKGAALLDQALDYAAQFRQEARSLGGLKCYREELLGVPGVKGLDGLKILIGTGKTGLTGYELDRILREKYQIQVEIADNKYILAMFSIFHQKQDWDYFYQALRQIAQTVAVAGPAEPEMVALPPYPEVVLSPRQAFKNPVKRMPLKECRGKLAGEMVAAYPPGIPCLLPGELITAAVQNYLEYLQQTGARLQGPEDISLRHLSILDV
mgnify:FL=1